MEPNPDSSREEYLADVTRWAMFMLRILKELPSTAEKLTLLKQVDKLKSAMDISSETLPAYAGALAVLSDKAFDLLRGKKAQKGYSKDYVFKLIRSERLRSLMEKESDQFTTLIDYLSIQHKDLSGSETLGRLSKSGH